MILKRKAIEIYCGRLRNTGIGGSNICTPDGCHSWVDQGTHKDNTIYLKGEWDQTDEYLIKIGIKEAYLVFKYVTKEVNLVMANSKSAIKARVLLDNRDLSKKESGKDIIFENKKSFVIVDHPDVYNLIKTNSQETHELKLLLSDEGLKAYAFRFG